jgi:hypothetical protein
MNSNKRNIYTHPTIKNPEEEEEEEGGGRRRRSLIKVIKRYARLAVAWDRHWSH